MNPMFMNILANPIDTLIETVTAGKLNNTVPQIHITT